MTQGIEESKARQALTEIQTQIGKTEAYIKTASAEDAIEQGLLKATTAKTEATTQNIKQATQQIIQQMIEYKGTGAREDLKVYNEQTRIKLDAILKAQGLEIYDQSVKNQLFQTAISLIKMTPH